MAVEFNKSELERMQSDAFRRLRDMQARSRPSPNGVNDQPANNSRTASENGAPFGQRGHNSPQGRQQQGYDRPEQRPNRQGGALPPRQGRSDGGGQYGSGQGSPQQDHRADSSQYGAQGGQYGGGHQQSHEQYTPQQEYGPRQQNGGYPSHGGQYGNAYFRQEGRPVPRPRESRSRQAPQPPPPEEKRPNSILSFLNFKGLDLDGDTSLIALLILLLSSDKNDELLMLALIYIML